MSGDLRISTGLSIPAGELIETASRSGGPGGQHVNKSSTRVTLRWSPAASRALTPAQRARIAARLAGRLTRTGALVVHAGRHRSRARNRELARERLAELVRGALSRRRARVPTRPGAGPRERRLAEKRQRAAVKRTRRPPHTED